MIVAKSPYRKFGRAILELTTKPVLTITPANWPLQSGESGSICLPLLPQLGRHIILEMNACCTEAEGHAAKHAYSA